MPGTHTRREELTIKHEESGQSLVEFALVLIFVILPVTMVFVEASALLYEYVTLTNAAREGAHAGSIYLYSLDPFQVSPCIPGEQFEICSNRARDVVDQERSNYVRDAVQGTLAPLIAPPPDCSSTSSATTCWITYGPSGAPMPDPLRSTDAFTVSITHTHALLFGTLGSQIELRARSSMRIEPSTVISSTGP